MRKIVLFKEKTSITIKKIYITTREKENNRRHLISASSLHLHMAHCAHTHEHNLDSGGRRRRREKRMREMPWTNQVATSQQTLETVKVRCTKKVKKA